MAMELWLPWQHIALIGLTWENCCHQDISFNLADNKDSHEISVEIDYGQNWIVQLSALDAKKILCG